MTVAADERVRAAVAHWAPRFVAQGVDANDFGRVTADVRAWDEWLPAWVAEGDRHAALAREAEARGRTVTAGEAWNRAALSYHFAKFVWLVDPERHREALRLSVEALRNAHRLLDPTAERLEIPFGGMRLAATLRRPPGVPRPPLALLVPGLDSTKEEFLEWENVFLRRGLATLSLDGPGQGETGLESTITPCYEEPVGAALDHLAGRADLDLDRVGAVGVSLGGYYAPRAAAYERRIRAAVAVSGPYDFGAGWETLPLPTREMIADRTGAADDEEARARASELSLAGVAELVEAPLLVVTGKRDRLIDWRQTKRIADEAPNATWVLYEEGNHVCNNIPYLYRPLAADWLREALA